MTTTRSTKMVKSAASVPSSSTKLKPAAKRHRLLSYDEILEWYQENQHIRHGYRPVSGLVKASLASCMYMHNETVNIYSHLLAAVASVLAMCYLSHYLHDHYPKVTKSDQIIFAFFLLTATICLGLSTTYHTFMNHSFALETICLHLDFVGIIFLTLGDFVSGIYMVFWCEPFQRKIYWTMVSCIVFTHPVHLLYSVKYAETISSDPHSGSPNYICHGES